AIGAVATRMSHAYGVGLATVGLLTTTQFLVHMAMQIPGGRTADRFGARPTAFAGLAAIAAGNAIALPTASIGLAFAGRAVVGFGTGLAFVSGSDYIRARGGSPFLQGVYGGGSVLAPGIALAIVPALAGFRAPYATAIVVVALAAGVLALAPPAARTRRHAGERIDTGFFRDRRLYRLAAIHAMSFGFSVIVGNWVVTLLEHHGHSKAVSSAAGSLTLLLGFFTRAAGGALLRRADASRWVAVSLVAGGAGAVALALPLPIAAAFAVCAFIGLAAGVPFAMAFTGAAAVRPDEPGAAVGFVNAWASLVVVAGTPLVGLTFALPGDGRIGFVVVGVLAALASIATPRYVAKA
ncbi:MAG: MFS transporter, partial [Acidobacteriota bacterium]|nr:MFS transporter [Acidobacteriota bacterium]